MTAPDDPNALRGYKLIAEIGRGGMADVHLAVSRGPAGWSKLVVIKKTLRDLATEPDVLAMFLDEARLAARMNHPNVVQTYEIGQDGDRYFIAMEYLDGQPYSRVCSKLRRELPLALHLRVLVDVLAGLHHAHELCDFDGTPLDVVHRDATPQNVFVTYDGSIKVVDFGIAKALDSSARTRTGVVKGKVTYMSPEQVRGEPLDRRSDVFSVGVMLWEAVARRRMWGELPDPTVVHELMHESVPPILGAAPGAPPELARIVDRALAPKRAMRYATALEMRRDLEAFLASSGERADARDVGAFLVEPFAEHRRRVQSVIESQLSDLRWTGTSPRATGRDLPLLEGAPRPLGEGSSDDAALGSGPRPRAEAVEPAPTNSGASLPMPVVHARPRSPLIPVIVGLGAMIVVLSLGIVLLVRPARREAATASQAPSPPVATATAPSSVKLIVRGKPAEVRIYLDGVLLSTGPFEGKVAPSDTPRKLRIEAERHLAKDEEITLSADLVVSFDLEKESPPAASAAPASTAPAGAPPAAGPRRVPRGKHSIDSDSPYKK